MSGHSKWKNIQHRKGSQDAKKGKIFTKIGTELTVAAKLHGADPDSNPRLRTALDKARVANMPKDNIERAIKKGIGGLEGVTYSEKVYEGYGVGGVAIVVECLTDNANRTVSDVRYAFTRHGGNLGTDGSVSWMFEKKGLIMIAKSNVKDPDKLMEVAIENGAEDVKDEDEEAYEITCAPEDFPKLKQAIDKLSLTLGAAEITVLPKNHVQVSDKHMESLGKMIDVLEDLDDVQNVFHNGDF